MKCLYLVTRSLDPTGTGATRWMQKFPMALLFALVTFFIIGGVLLLKVDIRRGVREAGNELPTVV